jgi:hypothetical protein
MVIILKNEKIRKKLLVEGHVIVFRENPHSVGKDWMTDKKGSHKICDVEITPVGTVSSISQLKPHVKDSGFETLREWIGEIKRQNPRITRAIGYLYEVNTKN